MFSEDKQNLHFTELLYILIYTYVKLFTHERLYTNNYLLSWYVLLLIQPVTLLTYKQVTVPHILFALTLLDHWRFSQDFNVYLVMQDGVEFFL